MANNSYEKYNVGKGSLPKALAKKLNIPENASHPLTPYVDEEMIPSNLEVILLEDLDGFCNELNGKNSSMKSAYTGLYLSSDHSWMPEEVVSAAKKALEEKYGLKVGNAILLPKDNAKYSSMIHEMLHSVFDSLPENKKEKMLESARKGYSYLHHMLGLTHLNVTDFNWDSIEPELEKRAASGQPPAGLYVLGNLSRKEQMQCMDEFISNYFANNRGKDRNSSIHMPEEIKDCMKEIGYNMDCPPEVK